MLNLLAFVVLVEDGIIYRFKGGSSLPKGNVTDDCPATDLTPCPSKKVAQIIKKPSNLCSIYNKFYLRRQLFLHYQRKNPNLEPHLPL